MARIVNRQVHRANPLVVSPLHFFMHSVFLPFIDRVFKQLSERFYFDLIVCIKFHFLMPSVSVKHVICFDQKCC